MIDTHKEIPASLGDGKSYNKDFENNDKTKYIGKTQDLKSKKSANNISTSLHHSDSTVNANLKRLTNYNNKDIPAKMQIW